MISSFLVEELADLAEHSSQMTLAYYFCDDKDEKRRTATAILRGLLLQLLRQRPSLFKHIQSQFDMSRDDLFSNFHALWRIFVSIVQDPEAGEVWCLIDALDECDRGSRQLFLTNLTKLFCSRQSKRTFVKFVVASRLENDIEESLSTVSSAIQKIQIDSGKVNEDLSKFIDLKVDELSSRKGYRSDTKNLIKHALTEKAGGTFLYVSLVLDDLKTTKTTLQVRQRLQTLPQDLNNVYDRILGNIDAECVEVAKLILGWVAVARRPLTVEELAMVQALGTEEWGENRIPPEDVLDELKDGFKCCEPLVYVDTAANTINLVHQSAKDYLLGKHLQENVRNVSQYHVLIDRTNHLIFRTCWRYLSFEEFDHGTVIIGCSSGQRLHQRSLSEIQRTLSEINVCNHCFLQYATQEWQKHAQAATFILATDEEFWSKNLNKLPTLRDFWLIRTARVGNEGVVQRLLENGANPEISNGFSTPLMSAARNGHEAVVKLLLSRDDVTVNHQNHDNDTALSCAAQNGHQAVVKLLLSRDHVTINHQNHGNDTALSLAARYGHEATVKLFLDRNDVAINHQNEDNDTPLSLAASYGHEATVKLLLDRNDVAINLQDRHGYTPLSLAAAHGNEAIVKLLLSRDDVAINSKDRYGRTPLWWATLKGHEAVVRLLLSRNDVAVDSKDKDGRTPLWWAALNGHEAVVKLLLSRNDVAVDSKDKDGRTPLWWAALHGHEAVVKLLLSRNDVAIDSKDRDGWTPLIQLASMGLEAMVKQLLKRDDVAVDSKDEAGKTALVAYMAHEAVVELLEQRMRDIGCATKSRKRGRSE